MAGIFSEEGLLKKHPLRGSSLAQRFASMAGEAGLGADYMSPKGVEEAASKLSSYTQGLGKELPDLTQKTSDTAKKIAEAQEKMKEAQQKQSAARQQEQSLELQLEAFKPKQLKKGKADPIKQAKEKYTTAVDQAQTEIDNYRSQVEQYQAQLQEQQGRVQRERTKQRDAAAFRNFVGAYARAIGDGANREQFLASVHGQMGPSPEVAADLSTVQDQYHSAHQKIVDQQQKVAEQRAAAQRSYDQAQEMKAQLMMKNKVRKAMGLGKIKKKERARQLSTAETRLAEALTRLEKAGDTGESARLRGEAADIARRGQQLEQRASLETAGLGYIFG